MPEAGAPAIERPRRAMPVSGTVLGFDFGRRRIGVAVGQTLTRNARALETLRARDGGPDWGAIERLVTTWQPAALVVGVPMNMDDTEHALAAEARRFARRLEGRFGVPVHTVDERLTSHEAQRQIAGERARGQRRRRMRKGDLDMRAAELILETWLQREDEPS